MARPKEFDRDDALDKAMDLFWQRGYAGASIEDLVRATGVGRQSLYDTFGDKRALYLAALARYEEVWVRAVRGILEAEGSPREILIDAIRRFAINVGDCSERGCMLVNAAFDTATDDDVLATLARTHKRLEKAFRTLLERAEAAGEIRPGQNLRAKARGLLNTIHGLRLTARPSGDRRMLADVIEDAIERIS